MADQVCPPLGTGSVDFNALHSAAAKGGDLAAAIEAATTAEEVAADPEPAPAPAFAPFSPKPAATGDTADASA